MNISRDMLINYTDDKAIITPLGAYKFSPYVSLHMYWNELEIHVAHRNIVLLRRVTKPNRNTKIMSTRTWRCVGSYVDSDASETSLLHTTLKEDIPENRNI